MAGLALFTFWFYCAVSGIGVLLIGLGLGLRWFVRRMIGAENPQERLARQAQQQVQRHESQRRIGPWSGSEGR